MSTAGTEPRRSTIAMQLAVVSTAALLLSACPGRRPAPDTGPTTGAGEHFSTPKAAVDTLLAACRARDEARIITIFGEAARAIVSTSDPAADRERCNKLVEAAGQSMRLDPKGPDTLELVVGTDDWAMPIPLVKDAKGWHFDAAEGMQEIRRRRIGADELEAIAACHVYVRAQEAYASRTRRGQKVYAQKLVSTPGKKDGLYWPSTGKGDVSPLGPVAAAAESSQGERPHGTWRGYHFRVLTAQGSNAPGGKRSYIVDGQMTGGFALVAYPVVYGSSGIMTFIVGTDGQIYQRDLGEKTDEIGGGLTVYAPDGAWKRVGG
jgi:Protein of unknown function (DUF2950)